MRLPEEGCIRFWFQTDLWEWIPKVRVTSDDIALVITISFLFIELEFIAMDRDRLQETIDEIYSNVEEETNNINPDLVKDVIKGEGESHQLSHLKDDVE